MTHIELSSMQPIREITMRDYYCHIKLTQLDRHMVNGLRTGEYGGERIILPMYPLRSNIGSKDV